MKLFLLCVNIIGLGMSSTVFGARTLNRKTRANYREELLQLAHQKHHKKVSGELNNGIKQKNEKEAIKKLAQTQELIEKLPSDIQEKIKSKGDKILIGRSISLNKNALEDMMIEKWEPITIPNYPGLAAAKENIDQRLLERQLAALKVLA